MSPKRHVPAKILAALLMALTSLTVVPPAFVSATESPSAEEQQEFNEWYYASQENQDYYHWHEWVHASPENEAYWRWKTEQEQQSQARASHYGYTSDGSPDSNRHLGYLIITEERGWSRASFDCVNAIWNQESGWSETADNPTSSAYGIPQANPGSKMASHGDDWQTNPRVQINWGLDYMVERYGSVCNAYAFKRRNGWY